MGGWWKRGVGVAVAMCVLAMLIRRRPHEARVDAAVKRRAAERRDVARARMPAGAYASQTSLWTVSGLGPCVVQTRWSSAPVSAHFVSVLYMDGPMSLKRKAYQPLRVASAIGASATVRLQPGGATVVRLVRSARFKPRRALFGGAELKAA